MAWACTKGSEHAKPSDPSTVSDAATPDDSATPRDASEPDDAATPAPQAALLLKVSENRRYLLDGRGRPFLIAGDAPQALLANLSVDDAREYFASRKAHGFNTLWINLLCDIETAGRSDASTLDAIQPFTAWQADGKYDLGSPNPAYFERVDTILKAAAEQEQVVFLDPIETRGWLATLRSNGLDTAFEYGRFLGTRYAGVDNIVWLSGNNFQSWRTSEDDALVFAVARGIREADARHLQTIMLDYPVSSSSDNATWAGSTQLDLDAVFSYPASFIQTLVSYNRTPTRPVYLAETTYENENLDLPPVQSVRVVRSLAYWSILSGATGHFYGHQLVWKFAEDWRDHLDSPGAQHVKYLQELLLPRPWHELVPDQTNAVVTAGLGGTCQDIPAKECDRAVAARTGDGRLVVAYMPSVRELNVDMTQLNGTVTARWYDPTSGAYTDSAESPLPNTGTHAFTPPAENTEGVGDWVLVLEADE
ncbi:MAG: hypothetical protein RL701_4391 [Pseudomonadota bacterium]